MSNYQTNNPVPSIDPRDLDDNATVFDKLMHDATPTVLDRLLVPRKTWWQVEQDAAALVSPNVTALAALTLAVNKGIYATGVGALATYDLTAQARTFAAAVTQADQRTVLGTAAESLGQMRGFGLGLTVGLASATSADANTALTTGTYSLSAGAANIPAASAGTLFAFKGLAGSITQIWNTPGTSDWYVRSSLNSGSSWSVWGNKATAGANANITSLTGLTTPLSVGQGGTGVTTDALHLANLIVAGAYAKSNIIGTVSQSGGVPTGAAFETGGTLAGTGKYFKHADGYMKILKTLAIGTGSTTAKGSIFGSAAVSAGSFPVAFVGDNPIVLHSGTDIVGGGWTALEAAPTLTTWGSYSTRAHVSQGASGTIYLVAEGRWF